MKKIFVIMVVLIGFVINVNAQYADPQVMQQKMNAANSQTKANDGRTVSTNRTESTTVGVGFLGNGVSTTVHTSTENGIKTTTSTTCTTKGVDVGFARAVKENCTTTTVTVPASSSSGKSK